MQWLSCRIGTGETRLKSIISPSWSLSSIISGFIVEMMTLPVPVHTNVPRTTVSIHLKSQADDNHRKNITLLLCVACCASCYPHNEVCLGGWLAKWSLIIKGARARLIWEDPSSNPLSAIYYFEPFAMLNSSLQNCYQDKMGVSKWDLYRLFKNSWKKN